MTKKTLFKESGFSLLEVLIALFVLSIGLLGVASLQIRGQQFNTAANLYSQATYLATDLMDRIHSHHEAIAGAKTSKIDELKDKLRVSYEILKELTVEEDCPESPACSATGCLTLEDGAKADLVSWCENFQKLPAGEIEIVADTVTIERTDATPENELRESFNLINYTITLRWANIARKDSGKKGSQQDEPKKKEQTWVIIQ